jgi:hypothetical protein
MEIEDRIYQRLVELATSVAGDRIRPGGASAESDVGQPSIVFRVPSKVPVATANGVLKTEHALVVIEGHAATYAGKQQLAAAIRQMKTWKDAAEPPGDIWVTSCLPEDPGEEEDFEEVPATGAGIWIARFTFEVWYRRR